MAFVARIAHGVVLGQADDLRFDEQRRLELRLGRVALVAQVVDVHEHEAAGLDLGPGAAGRFVREGARARAGDDVGRHFGRLQQAAHGVHLLGRLDDGGVALGHGTQVLRAAVVGLQAGQAQAAAPRQLARQGDGALVRRHAAAALADVDFDVHVDHRAGQHHGLGQPLDAFAAVHRDGQAPPARVQLVRQRRHAAQLGHAEHLVADQHVVDAAGAQRLGLGHGLRAQAHCAGLQLQAPEQRALVRLAVRAQAQAVLGGEFDHALQVAVDRVEIDHQRGRADVIDALAHQRAQVIGQGFRLCFHRVMRLPDD